MRSYEVLKKAIPEREAPKVAKFLGVSSNYVNRWRRQPAGDDDPKRTGQRSILDRITDLIDVVFLVNRPDAGLIVQFITAHHDRLLKTHATPITCHVIVADTIEDLLSETKDVVNAITREGASPNTLRELVQLRDRTQIAIDSVQSTLDATEEKSTHA